MKRHRRLHFDDIWYFPLDNLYAWVTINILFHYKKPIVIEMSSSMTFHDLWNARVTQLVYGSVIGLGKDFLHCKNIPTLIALIDPPGHGPLFSGMVSVHPSVRPPSITQTKTSYKAKVETRKTKQCENNDDLFWLGPGGSLWSLTTCSLFHCTIKLPKLWLRNVLTNIN